MGIQKSSFHWANGRLVASLTATIVAVAIAACGSDGISAVKPTPVARDTGQLIPLAIGTRWTYDRVDSVEFTTDSLDKSYHGTNEFGVIADTLDNQGTQWAVLDHSNCILGGLIWATTI